MLSLVGWGSFPGIPRASRQFPHTHTPAPWNVRTEAPLVGGTSCNVPIDASPTPPSPIAAQSDSKLPGVIPVAPGLSHSLHPDLYRHELSGSLERLRSTAVGAYLIEHPEHHLASRLGLSGEAGQGGIRAESGGGGGPPAPDGARLADARDEFYEQMTTLFEAMEERADADGRLKYGVSSAGLSLSPSDPMHVSWEALVACAEKAASRAGRPR